MMNFIEKLDSGVKLEMIAIPGGSFMMGSEVFYDTKPVHRVTLSPFYIGQFQITQAQYYEVMCNNPSEFIGNNLPVEMVSWFDAVEFCEKLSKQTGQEYRLPTEAEWEYACQAGSTGKYCFGDDDAILKDHAWYIANSADTTHPVGEKLPNNWGLYDMHGNVWEWCLDWYGEKYYRKSHEHDPQGPVNKRQRKHSRVVRSGSWYSSPLLARAVSRVDLHAGFRDFNLGFRVVLSRPHSS